MSLWLNSSKKKNLKILEPSCGEGVFCKTLKKEGFKKFVALEIDKSIKPSYAIQKSFISHNFTNNFDVVIGNPPYIRWKNLNEKLKKELKNSVIWQKNFNSICDYLYIFIFKSLEILEEDGEIIFITPEYWFKNLHSQNLRNYILRNGYIKEIYYLGENKYFDKVNSSFVIFKIVKKKINPKIQLFKLKDNVSDLTGIFLNIEKNFKKNFINQFQENKKWLLFDQEDLDECDLIEKSCEKNNNNGDLFGNFQYTKLKDISQIANGLVSGLDKAFVCDEIFYKKLNNLEKKALVKIVKSYNIKAYVNQGFQNYIFLNNKIIKNFKKEYPNFYKHFQKFKKILNQRYNYNKKINYWEWTFLRSYSLISSSKNKISIPCKLRVTSFEDIKFCLIKNDFLLTQDVTSIYFNKQTKEDIFYILGYFNSNKIKKWIYINNNNRGNVLEFSEEPLNNIPIRLINWKSKEEVKIHKKISNLTQKIIKSYDLKLVNEIDKLVNRLLNL